MEVAEKYSTAICCENVSLTNCHLSQADAIYNMVGYPEFIMNATKLDKVFNDVGKCKSGLPCPNFSLLFVMVSFASLKCLILFSVTLIPFSLLWCQAFTSRMLCSTTTSQAE